MMSCLDEHERHVLIRNLLRIKGSSFSGLARDQGVTVSSISLVSKSRAKSERLELAIAAAVGLTRQELWPERIKRNTKEAEMT